MKKINVLIVNGKPRSGKDTVINYIKDYCNVDECAIVHHYSTIDPVKSALKALGWDGNKDANSRNTLAALKQLWIESCDGPLRHCMDKIFKSVNNNLNDDEIIIFQIREPEEIDKLVNAIKPISRAYNMHVTTLFVSRLEAEKEEYGNDADMNVAKYRYDEEIMNNGTLEQLKEVTGKYTQRLMEGKYER